MTATKNLSQCCTWVMHDAYWTVVLERSHYEWVSIWRRLGQNADQRLEERFKSRSQNRRRQKIDSYSNVPSRFGRLLPRWFAQRRSLFVLDDDRLWRYPRHQRSGNKDEGSGQGHYPADHWAH